ncbi:MAG: maleylpyruvate isomerase N-terminal domain-containing protein [Actinomycetota bacterium]|nr:maleylpyruvate isomerase N-terminal domain-containing protein [Actinomycetota bacterium]
MPVSDRHELADKVEQSVRRLHSRLSDASAEILQEPHTIGTWAIRDLVAHMVYWHEQCIWAIRTTMNGTYERRDYSEADDHNERAVIAMSSVPATQLLEKLLVTGLDVAGLVREVPDEMWEAKPRLERWVVLSTLEHHVEHQLDLDKALTTQ